MWRAGVTLYWCLVRIPPLPLPPRPLPTSSGEEWTEKRAELMALLGQIRLALPSVGRPREKQCRRKRGFTTMSKLKAVRPASGVRSFLLRTILQRQTYETSYAEKRREEKRRVVQVSIFARFFAELAPSPPFPLSARPVPHSEGRVLEAAKNPTTMRAAKKWRRFRRSERIACN